MLALNIIEWWYVRGWMLFVQNLRQKLHNDADFFSIGLLFRTLFEPFRQISANSEAASEDLPGRLSVFFDKLLSRVIGAVVRTIIIFVGILLMILEAIFGLILIILWPAVPFLPILGIVFSITGVLF